MGKEANSSRRYRQTPHSDAYRTVAGAPLSMHGGQRSSREADLSIDWPPLFVGPAKGVYKHQVLAKSQSKASELNLERALLDCCGGKADPWIGNDRLGPLAHVAIRSIRWLLRRLESRGKW